MNLVADESVDQPIVDQLRRDGHDVLYIAEMPQAFSVISPGIVRIRMGRSQHR